MHESMSSASLLEPENYFFFQGPGSGIHINNNTSSHHGARSPQIIWPFISGFSIIQSFKIEEENPTGTECPLLFSFHAN